MHHNIKRCQLDIMKTKAMATRQQFIPRIVMTLVGLIVSLSAHAQGHKIALLIGVQYELKALQLHTKADVDAMKGVLTSETYGFDPKDIAVLDTPESTTKDSIEKAFTDLAKRTKKDDIVFIHYSGHGSQVKETVPGSETDGKDETIVGSDYSNKVNAQITDDQIALFLRAIGSSQPLSITVVFDCCHSGTGTRDGVGLSRKLPDDLATTKSDDQVTLKKINYAGQSTTMPNLVVFGACRFDEIAKESLTPTGPMGALTRALVESMTTTGVGPETACRDIIADTASRVRGYNPGQTPQLEGNGLQKFLGGKIQRSAAFVPIREPDVINPGHAKLMAGFLTNVQIGAVYSLYKIGKPLPEPEDFVCDMKVQVVNPFDADLALTDDTPENRSKLSDLFGLHAVLTGQPAALKPLVVAVDEKLAATSQWKNALTAIKSSNQDIFVTADMSSYRSILPKADQAKPCDVRIEMDSITKSIVFREANAASTKSIDGRDISVIPAWDDSQDKAVSSLSLSEANLGPSVAATLNRVSKLRFLTNGLHNASTYSKVSMQIRLMKVSVKTEQDATGQSYDTVDVGTTPFNPKVTPDSFKPVTGTEDLSVLPVLGSNDRIIIQVKNTGYLPAYAHIIDITAVGEVSALWPRQEDPSTKEAIMPCAANDRNEPDKGWVTLSYLTGGGMAPHPFKIVPPLGREMFRLLSTTVPLDIQSLVDQVNARGIEKDSQGPLAEAIRMSTLGQRTDSTARPVPLSEWWSTAYEFIVQEKK